jgi:hypothetical protein
LRPGLLAWVAQLDEKRNVNKSSDACITERKAARRSDDFNSQNKMIGLLTTSHSEAFPTI